MAVEDCEVDVLPGRPIEARETAAKADVGGLR
jgi:hypothetical protein